MASVLLVEDAFDASEALASYLRKHGHEVRVVGNGREALAAVIMNPPDAVVLDLFLPEIDGPSFLEVLRLYLRMTSLPVVVLTGLPDSPMVERARRLKVNSVLVKGKAGLDDIYQALVQSLHQLPR